MNPTVAKIIDELCTEIETLIREGSTPVTSPTCEAAREYLKDHGFGQPTQTDLLKKLEEEVTKDVNTFLGEVADIGQQAAVQVLEKITDAKTNEGPSGTIPHGVEV